MHQTPTVLIIEDELLCRNLYKEALSNQNINVFMASDGTTALNLLKGGLVCSVIIADYELPDMNGLHLFEEASKFSPVSTKIMITARKEEEMHPVNTSKAEIVHFMTKPIDVKQFVETILSGINRYQQKMKNGPQTR